MDSFLILVDAGYVYASAGTLVHGTKARHELLLNHGALRDHLESFGRETTGVSMLRMYWYDAAPNRMPTPEHDHIASLRAVQLRLGRLSNAGLQKGVDSLIYRDLFTLSQSGRVSDIFLVAGDEDLLEGVNAAKDFGVRISLIGIEPNRSNQSDALRHAADAVYILQREQLEPLMHRKRSVESSHPPSADRSGAHQQSEVHDGDSDAGSTPDGDEVVRGAARQVAHEYWTQTDADERAYLETEERRAVANRRLPQRTDGWMLRIAAEGLSRRLTESEKWLARAEFWKEIAVILGEADGSSAAGTEARDA